MQSYVTHIGILLLAGPLLAALVCLGLSVLLFKAQVAPGWRSVRPGIGYWTGFTLSLGLAALIGWVWLYVGSARADGLFQMKIAWWLAFLFGCGSAFAGFRIVSLHRLDLRWRAGRVPAMLPCATFSHSAQMRLDSPLRSSMMAPDSPSIFPPSMHRSWWKSWPTSMASRPMQKRPSIERK